MFTCTICRCDYEENEMAPQYINICKNCAADSKSLIVKRDNEDWQKVAEDNSLELYERQPGEGDTEWYLWQCFSGQYPNAKPNLRLAAEQAGISYNYARRIFYKWDYNVRIQVYKAFIDEVAVLERKKAVVEMQESYTNMANKLRSKVNEAIQGIVPALMKPSEIVQMAKLVTELEQKAHLDKTVREVIDYKPRVNNVKEGQKELVTKKEDMTEILNILGAAGILKDSTIGIEQTTRVVVKGSENDETYNNN